MADQANASEGGGQRRRVLLVEDELMVAMLVEDMLADMGCAMLGPMSQLDEALQAARTGVFDLAILDLNLAGQETYPVADALIERGIPFLFATGYGVDGLRPAYKNRLTLQKPFQQRDLVSALSSLAAVEAAAGSNPTADVRAS